MRTLFLVFLLTLSLPALAQDALTERGTLLIGGTATISQTNQNDFKTTGVALLPRIGVFVIDGLAVGAEAGVTYSRSTNTVELFGEDPIETTFSTTILQLAPFATYYFGAPEAAVHPFVGVSVGGQSLRFSSEFQSEEDSATRTALFGTVSAGALLRLGTNVGLTGEAFYDFVEVEDQDSASVFGLRGGIAVFLGR